VGVLVANAAAVVAAVEFEADAIGGCALVDLACVLLVTDGLGGTGIDFDDSGIVWVVAGATTLLAVAIGLCCATVGTRLEEASDIGALVAGTFLLPAEALARFNAWPNSFSVSGDRVLRSAARHSPGTKCRFRTRNSTITSISAC
jgi:hypothetical protein